MKLVTFIQILQYQECDSILGIIIGSLIQYVKIRKIYIENLNRNIDAGSDNLMS